MQTPFQVTIEDEIIFAAFGDIKVPLDKGHEARQLRDLDLLVRSAPYISNGLRRHLDEHFSRASRPSGSCEFCKLQGRILAAEGRHRVAQQGEGGARYVAHFEGKVVVRRTPHGISGKDVARAWERAAKVTLGSDDDETEG